MEPNAGNTGENIELSRELLASAGLTPKSVLLVSTPYMERRSFATARKLWPEVEVLCASEPMEFDDYLKSIGDEKLVIDMLVGDLQRTIEYPKQGSAIEQDVPENVYAAYEDLTPRAVHPHQGRSCGRPGPGSSPPHAHAGSVLREEPRLAEVQGWAGCCASWV